MQYIDEKEPLSVYINSGGGGVFEGMAVYNILKRHEGKVTIYVDGLAASMASIIALSGDELIMNKGTTAMIHDPLNITYGNASDHQKSIEILNGIKANMISIYSEALNKTDEEISEIMSNETWYSAEEAVEVGFADKINDDAFDSELIASFDSSSLVAKLKGFKNVPENVKNKFFTEENEDIETNNNNLNGGISMSKEVDKQNSVEASAATPDAATIKADAVSEAQAANQVRMEDIKSTFEKSGLAGHDDMVGMMMDPAKTKMDAMEACNTILMNKNTELSAAKDEKEEPSAVEKELALRAEDSKVLDDVSQESEGEESSASGFSSVDILAGMDEYSKNGGGLNG